MFKSIILPLDLEESGDRPLRFVRRLASLASVPIELVTVSSPNMQHDVDEFELDRRRRRFPDAHCTVKVLHSDDTAGALVGYLAGRPGSLIAMATNARGPLAERVFGSVSEAVLASRVGPVLLFGPCCRAGGSAEPPELLVALDESEDSEAVLSTAEEWATTFGGALKLVEYAPQSVGDDELGRAVRHVIRCTARGRWNDASWEVLDGANPARALLDYGNQLDNVVVAMASGRWTDEHPRPGSVARAVTHMSRFPLLVVSKARGAV